MLYLPGSFDYEEIIRQWRMLEQTVTESVRDAEIDETIERERLRLCEAVLKKQDK